MYDGNTESNEKMTKKGSSIIMKKAVTNNAKCAIIAILSVIILIALASFAIGAVNAADSADRQTTGYGTVDWSTAAQGYISFTASGAERILVLQDPSGRQVGFAVDKDETVKISLEDGSGIYQYAIGRYTDDGTDCHVDCKNSFSVN